MSIGNPGGLDTYIPTFDHSGRLIIGFSRNPKKFPLNRYVQYQTVKAPRGQYLYFNPLDPGRLRNPNIGTKWPLGSPRPRNTSNTQGFEYKQYLAERHAHSTTVDTTAVDLADWDVQASHLDNLAQQAMTERAYNACATLTTSGNYAASHVFTAASVTGTGAFLDGGTTADPRIKKVLDYASRVIQQDTGGRIRFGDLGFLVNAKTAQIFGQTREYREFVMQQAESLAAIRLARGSDFNAYYGLPETFYGYEAVVEDTFYNPVNSLNASEAYSPCFPDNTMLVFVRQGALDVSEGTASYSTMHFMIYEDMKVETKEDTWNRLVDMSVVDYYVPQLVAPVSACLITNLFS